MVIVDTHVHASPYWFEPIETVLFQMDRNKVDKATLAQHWGQFDNQYLIDCARRFPGRFCPVVVVDTESNEAPETLKQWVKSGAKAFRTPASTRSPGKDKLAIWRAAHELGLPITIEGSKEEFASEEFGNIIKTFPNVPIILEHLCRTQKDELPPYANYRKILALSRNSNVYVKIGGLGEFCKRPFPFRQPFPFETVPPLVKMAYDSFGPSRMMWGSNYSVSSSIEGYENTLRYLEQYLTSFCTQEDKEWIFGKTALSVFRF